MSVCLAPLTTGDLAASFAGPAWPSDPQLLRCAVATPTNVTVRNDTSTATSGATLTLRATPGWTISRASVTLPPLNPGAATQITVQVTAPASAQAGTYDVNANIAWQTNSGNSPLLGTVAIQRLRLG